MPAILDIILYLVTIVGSILIVAGMIKLKYSKKTQILVLSLVGLVSFLLTIGLSKIITRDDPVYYVEMLIVNIVIILIAIFIMAKDNKWSVIFACVTQIDVIIIICYVSMALARVFGGHAALEILFRVGGFILMTIFYKVLLEDKYRNFVDTYKEKKGWILVLFIPLGFLGIFYVTLLYPISIFDRAIHAHNVMVVTILSMATTYASIFSAFNMILEKYKIQDEANKAEAKSRLWKLQLENQEDIIETTKKARHNLRHHDTLLIKFLEDGETQKAIDYLKQHIENNALDKSLRYCLNYTINSLLTIYVNKAEKHGIITKCEAKVDNELKIDDVKLTNILANLLENAIEACEKLDEETHKFIDIEILASDKNVKVLIRNSCIANVEFDDNNFPISTKEIKSGIGTKNVASIVEENNGFVDYSEKDGVFEARIVINY